MPPAVFQLFASVAQWLMAEAKVSWWQEEGIEVQIHKAFRHPAPNPQLLEELWSWPSVRATGRKRVF